MYPQHQYTNPYAAPVSAGVARVAFLRKVYALFTTSIFAAAGGALFALYAGTGASEATFRLSNGAVQAVPPLVALLSSGWIAMIVGFLVMLGAFMFAGAVRQKPVINWIALHGAAAISGVYIAPMIFYALLMASAGHTLSPAPVRDAFLLSSIGFVGLTGYTMVSKKDFSFLRGFVSIGFFVVFGALLLSLFVHSAVFELAVASAGVLLFSAYILYDTSRILRAGTEDPVGAAITLYLDFFNLFMMLLMILSSQRD